MNGIAKIISRGKICAALVKPLCIQSRTYTLESTRRKPSRYVLENEITVLCEAATPCKPFHNKNGDVVGASCYVVFCDEDERWDRNKQFFIYTKREFIAFHMLRKVTPGSVFSITGELMQDAFNSGRLKSYVKSFKMK